MCSCSPPSSSFRSIEPTPWAWAQPPKGTSSFSKLEENNYSELPLSFRISPHLQGEALLLPSCSDFSLCISCLMYKTGQLDSIVLSNSVGAFQALTLPTPSPCFSCRLQNSVSQLLKFMSPTSGQAGGISKHGSPPHTTTTKITTR